jgi:glutathione synthase
MHGSLIIKPLYEFGGRFIAKAETLDQLKDVFSQEKKRNPELPIMVQKFLPAIAQGDKRIFMLQGQVIGCFTKKPDGHEYLSNLAFGGQGVPDQLTEREHLLCQDLAPFLKKYGLFFVGLDVIDGHLTEINVTSPTGIPTLNHLYGRRVEKELLDAAIVYYDKIMR